MEKRFILEVCVDSLESAMAAERGGADRLEVCQNLFEGGTTPNAGLIRLIRERSKVSANVMIRPRGGDFCYTKEDYAVMEADVEIAKRMGANGVVLGLLREDGTIDVERTRDLIQRARPLSVTFHRAFDMSADPFGALEELIRLGVDRVLTSGQERSALEGLDLITQLVARAGDRIIILPGGGITERNVKTILEKSGAREFHVSGSMTVPSRMQYRNTRCFMGRELRAPEYSHSVVDGKRIEGFLQAVGQ
jgi:copper homeostasis protein